MSQLGYNPFRLINLALNELRDPPGSYFAYPFVRYLLVLSECVVIKTIIIGQEPYGRPIYPSLGSAFAFDTNSVPNGVTPSVAIFREYMRYADESFGAQCSETLVEAFANSFKLLHRGYIFINASIGTFMNSANVARHIIETAAFLRNLTFSRRGWKEFEIQVVCFGSLAQELGNLYANSVNKDIKVSVIRTVHPAYLSRLPLVRRRKLAYFGNIGVTRVLKDIVLNYVAIQREMSTFSFDDLSRCLRNIQIQLETKTAEVKVHLQQCHEHLEEIPPSAPPAIQSLSKALRSMSGAMSENDALTTIFSDALGTVMYVLGSKAVSPTTAPSAPLTTSQTRPREMPRATLTGSLAWPKGTYEPDSEDEEENESAAAPTTKSVAKTAKVGETRKPANLVVSESESDTEIESAKPIKPSVAGSTTFALNKALLDEAPHSVYAESDAGTVVLETPLSTPRTPCNLVLDSSESDSEAGSGPDDVPDLPEMLAFSKPVSVGTITTKPTAITALIVMTRRFRTDPKVLNADPCRYQLVEDLVKTLAADYTKNEEVEINLVPDLNDLIGLIRELESASNIKEIVTAKSHPLLTQLRQILTNQ